MTTVGDGDDHVLSQLRGWTAGEQPWVRQYLDTRRRVQCYFCGHQTAILSTYDRRADFGRIEVYCDSPQCDARETVILLRRGETVNRRADVRALQLVDRHVPPAAAPEEFGDGEPEYEEFDVEDDPGRAWWEEIVRLRGEPVRSGDETPRRRISDVEFALDFRGHRLGS